VTAVLLIKFLRLLFSEAFIGSVGMVYLFNDDVLIFDGSSETYLMDFAADV
jgi:hypothetical protein